MAGKLWYEVNAERLVLEFMRVKALYPTFRLIRAGDVLKWHGSVSDFPPGVHAVPLNIIVEYLPAFPASPPTVHLLNSEIGAHEVGHSWHRWYGGDICFIRPRYWQISTTTEEIISKVADWYFNYLATKAGLIPEMPDVGRARIPASSREGSS
jgi:hypothetical protein